MIGHKEQQQQITTLLSNKRLPHALLLTGPEGIGKATFALWLAQEIFGQQSNKTEANHSKLIESGNHPDIHFVLKEEGKRNIAVETIRDTLEKTSLKPYLGCGSVVIIDNAHEMHTSGHNAMLKTLEEPNPDCYLILITHSSHLIPETVISRCQQVFFSPLKSTELEGILARISSSNLSENELKQLIKVCEGSLAPLGLDTFISPRNKSVTNSQNLVDHLKKFNSQLTDLYKTLETLASNEASGSEAISIASELSEEKTELISNWYGIHTFIRGKMNQSASADQKRRWASLLEESIHTYRQISIGNAQPQLQLTSLLIKMWEIPQPSN